MIATGKVWRLSHTNSTQSLAKQTFNKFWRFLHADNRRFRLRQKVRQQKHVNKLVINIKLRLGLLNQYLPHREQQILQDLNKYRR